MTIKREQEVEQWKQIADFPNYWVSNKGRVWSSASGSFVKGSPLKNGHVDISLRKNNKRVHRYLHRLIAEAFIPNPNNYPEVRHLDDDQSNNKIDNLAWGTQYDNIQDCIRNGHFRYFTKEDIERANQVRRTPLVAIRLRDGKKYFFDSQTDAARKLGLDQASISAVIRGCTRSAGGYYFVAQEDFDNAFDYCNRSYQRRGIPIKAINLKTGEKRVYNKPRYAAIDLGISEASVSNVLHGKARSAKGWIFRELEDEEDDNDEHVS